MTEQFQTPADGVRPLNLVLDAPEPPPPGECLGGKSRVPRWYFMISGAALCGVGLSVVLLGHWFMLQEKSWPTGQRNSSPAELRILQPLITGNLALFMAWVWLDLRAPRRNEADADARFGLWLFAAAVAVVSTFGGATWAGVFAREPFVPFLLFLVGPVLAVTVPLLWIAARRIERSWLRAALLAGVVATSAIVQHGHKTGNDAELSVFTMNSCLIGIAVAAWLITWATTPEPRGTA